MISDHYLLFIKETIGMICIYDVNFFACIKQWIDIYSIMDFICTDFNYSFLSEKTGLIIILFSKTNIGYLGWIVE